MIVTGQPVIDWVAGKIGNTTFTNAQGLGVEKDGRIVGGAVIDSYVKDVRCALHCAGEGKRWLSREFLFVVFDYVFRQLNCKVIINTVNSTNVDSLRFTKHIGFSPLPTIKDGGVGGDLVIFTLHKDECRWLKRETP